ncbi:unnamed protein product [Cuscuta europaea]|uniref:EngB-type G domain-containing protein n=1 Tax=Cuscuta europaea TaxID=41803 RepID=A0A9P1EB71_CUSEU|nr:unnamed protein product [Cuscuta europaea]
MGLKTIKVDKKFKLSVGKLKSNANVSISNGKKTGSKGRKADVNTFEGDPVSGARGWKGKPKYEDDGRIKSISSVGKRKRTSGKETSLDDNTVAGLGSRRSSLGKDTNKLEISTVHSRKGRENGESPVSRKTIKGDSMARGRKSQESEFYSEKKTRAKPKTTSMKGNDFEDSMRKDNGKRISEVSNKMKEKKENEQNVELVNTFLKKNVDCKKGLAGDVVIKEGPRKKNKRIRIDPHDGSNKRLDDGMSMNDNDKHKKEDILQRSNNAEISKNAQFRAILPSPSILSYVEENLLGRRREIELRRAGYNVELSAPLDNIPSVSSSERQQIEEPVFRNKLNFFAAAKISSSFPPLDLPEIAFAGRSNVGKSSLLNALTRQWGVVRTSDKPGLTQTINFFNLGRKLCLVDLPGYGFAYAKEELKESWQELVKEYVSTRVGLERVCLLIDTKWGMKAMDYELIEMMERAKRKYQIILTKSDTVFPIDVARRAMQIEENLKANKSVVQPLMMVSSKSGAGIRSLRTALTKIARFAKL